MLRKQQLRLQALLLAKADRDVEGKPVLAIED
jgi:hypothetical protein